MFYYANEQDMTRLCSVNLSQASWEIDVFKANQFVQFIYTLHMRMDYYKCFNYGLQKKLGTNLSFVKKRTWRHPEGTHTRDRIPKINIREPGDATNETRDLILFRAFTFFQRYGKHFEERESQNGEKV